MEWISVKEVRLPKHENIYFVIYLKNEFSAGGIFRVDVVIYDQEQYRNIDGKPYDEDEITHWMPLPEPAKSNEE